MGDSDRLFDRFTAIDWSGAKKNSKPAVAEIGAQALRPKEWSCSRPSLTGSSGSLIFIRFGTYTVG
jgi:hypothetical protein